MKTLTKFFAGFVSVIGALFAGSQIFAADIVTYTPGSNTVSWDFSTIVTSLMTVITLAITSAVVIFIVMLGWRYIRRFFK